MGLIELLLIAVGLSMDAFAVSVTNGLCYKNVKLKWTFAMGLCFGCNADNRLFSGKYFCRLYLCA